MNLIWRTWEMRDEWPVILIVVVAVVLLGVAYFLWPSPPSLPPELSGEYDGFDVVGVNQDDVIVSVRTNNPDRYITALHAAIALAEEATGRRVTRMVIAGTPSCVYLTLGEEKAEQ